jgi:hypothetical protein
MWFCPCCVTGWRCDKQTKKPASRFAKQALSEARALRAPWSVPLERNFIIHITAAATLGRAVHAAALWAAVISAATIATAA